MTDSGAIALDTLDLTPSPRILEMIAEVDLKTWQCLAELIDNCFDELRRASQENPAREHRVDIVLPSSGQASRDSEIVVSDNGRGMTIDQMRTALRAGSSGNQAHGNLGLFGMGFNVATARMGSVTTVKTGRLGDNHWAIATIDISQMRREDTYQVPITREPKDPSVHGTIISVSNLKTDMIQRLRSTQEVTQTKKQLGRVYSYILRDPEKNKFSGSEIVGGMGIPLYLNGTAVAPVLPCIWDPSRTVTRRGKEIAALQSIDRPLSDAFACMSCGFWHSVEPSACTECGSTDIEQRSRKITGWLGIQRYNHKNDFGVNFIRLGRAIAVRDKGLFDWEGEFGKEPEYPIEVGDGRIVGEIHLDHAPVNFRKTDFDRENRAWTSMYEAVHGLSPLQPNKARDLGMERIDTPLVLLFDGFRRNDPGLNYLVPGNGSTAIHDRARQWGDAFHKAVPGFETDEKWYLAAKTHDDIVNGIKDDKTRSSQADEEFFEGEGLGDLLNDDEPPAEETPGKANGTKPTPPPTVPESAEERFARYEENSTALPELEGKLRVGANTTSLRALITSSDLSAEGSAHYAVRVKGGETQVFVSDQCPLICDFGWAPSDVALLFASRKIMNVYGVNDDPSEFLVGLIEQFNSRKLDAMTVRHRGEDVLELIREVSSPIIEGDPERYWLSLGAAARREAEDVAVRATPDIAWDAAIEDGSYGRYLTPNGFVDLLRTHAGDFLDGAAFTTKYASWSEAAVREEQVDRLCGLLHDLRRMISGVRANQPRELARYVMSTDLLSAEVLM